MVVDKVGGIGPNYGPRKTESSSKKDSASVQSDKIVISDEAAKAAEVDRLAKLASASQDPSRVEKLRDVKTKLANGEYNNPSEEMLGTIAEKISDVFFNRTV